ncbi:hypothetical protein HZZ13_05365 [Bradyrhizobium sp. CNPSo 4010]|uniref:Transposase n=1 Tax=Bradyrhizobium agreste TaxID=2751811 RepID=A0ABS0PJ37_9BRAD|nr:hypothetical protein [Bradyrhizobium agreste]MBH5397222.1 hypothetical protein [Bradyrhizobium agreste]
MAACPEQTASPADDLEVAADQAIAACGGDARETVKALLIAFDFLEVEAAELRAALSKGYSRGRHAALGRRKEIQ